mmetsp:Transcript_5907/g.6793  ORF Transcript_5907/g.6793 Transcript_5907/m.6793 type:complete len:164 (-) Transcript_5907:1236-1727(-)
MHSISTHHPVDLHARVNLLRHGYGAYAIAVRKAHLGCIRDYLQYTLLNPLDSRCLIYNHDIAWWKSDRLFGSQAPAYVATPLLVDHGEGYSLTWNGIRGVESDWMGRPDYWNIYTYETSDRRWADAFYDVFQRVVVSGILLLALTKIYKQLKTKPRFTRLAAH